MLYYNAIIESVRAEKEMDAREMCSTIRYNYGSERRKLSIAYDYSPI